MIGELRAQNDSLAADYEKAAERAEAAARVARDGGQYPLLSGGDVNLYSLFVEQATSLIRAEGIIGLLTPSGIASDKTAAPFFRQVATAGRLYTLFDFENRNRPSPEPPNFFPDVDSRFKFCVFAAGGRKRRFPSATCAFFLHSVREIVEPERTFRMTARDFALLNPNTGTAPIFRTKRDAEITTAIYERLPVLVDRSSGEEEKVWRVRYVRMFDMTNDSDSFRNRQELEASGAYPVAGNRWKKRNKEYLPLYEGKMIHQFDHRSASIRVNEQNLHNPALSNDISDAERADPRFVVMPRFWVCSSHVSWLADNDWTIGFGT